MLYKTLLMIALLANTLFAQKLEKVSLQLHWKYQFEFAGFIAAKEKGFYKDVGLDVELKEFTGKENIVEDVIEGRSTYGLDNSTLLQDYFNGKPVVLLASFFKRSAMVLITKKNIHSPKELQGKVILTSSKKEFHEQFGDMLHILNVETSSFKFKEGNYSIKPFIEGKVDALMAFVSDETYKLDVLKIPYNIIDPSDYGMYTFMMELFTSRKEANYHYRRTLAFKEASIRGWEYALKHKEEIVQIIHDKYAPSLSFDFLLNEAHRVEKLILPYVYPIGAIDFVYLKYQKDNVYRTSNKTLEQYIFDYSIEVKTETFLQIVTIGLLIILFLIYRQKKLTNFTQKLKKEIATRHKLENQLQRLNKDLEVKIAKGIEHTEKKNRELHTLLGHFQSLLDTTMEMVIVVNAQKQIVDINKSGVKMLGYENKEELIDQSIYDFIASEDLESTKKYRRMMITPTYEVKFVCKDGSFFPALIRAKSTLVDGQIFRMVTAMDLTDIKEKETLLQKQSHLAQMGEMLSMIAHQWRQPLNAMSASAIKITLKQELGSLTQEEIIEHGYFIQKQTQQMSKVIDDFMNFFKPENQKQYFTFVKVIDSIFSLTKAQLINKNIELKVEEKSAEQIFGYEKELSHVVLNLVSNARDAFDGKDIENKYIKVVFDANEFEYIISVCDNAGGIPKNIIDKVFNPYFTTKEEGKGTGIGLYMSKKILDEIFNATIDVSNTNEGAKFTIKIPKGENENGK